MENLHRKTVAVGAVLALCLTAFAGIVVKPIIATLRIIANNSALIRFNTSFPDIKTTSFIRIPISRPDKEGCFPVSLNNQALVIFIVDTISC